MSIEYKSLASFYSQIPDSRQKSGLRHPLVPFLLMSTMSIMSGFSSNNQIAKFMKYNQEEFSTLFNLKHNTPGHTQVGTIFKSIESSLIIGAFNRWASQFRDILKAQDGVSGDGKSLRSTLSNEGGHQSFEAVVSYFSHEQQLVLAVSNYDNGKESEIPCLPTLLTHFESKGMILTLDALHCQKNDRRNNR